MDTIDDRPRVNPSGRNGNRLPLRRPGERIGGRQKGTPNKMSGELKEAIIAAAKAAARGVPSGKGGLRGFLEMPERIQPTNSNAARLQRKEISVL